MGAQTRQQGKIKWLTILNLVVRYEVFSFRNLLFSSSSSSSTSLLAVVVVVVVVVRP
jgi:hypothetical protein